MEEGILDSDYKANDTVSCKELTAGRPVDHARRCYAWICFILLICCAGTVRGNGEQLCRVQDTATLLEAMRNQCSTIVITGTGFTMEQTVVASMVADLSEHRGRPERVGSEL
jgi:hypothetical protein